MIKKILGDIEELSGPSYCKARIIDHIDSLESENKRLEEENNILKRRVFGLETTVSHLKEKEEKLYKKF